MSEGDFVLASMETLPASKLTQLIYIYIIYIYIYIEQLSFRTLNPNQGEKSCTLLNRPAFTGKTGST